MLIIAIIKEILKKYNMTDYRRAATPLNPRIRLFNIAEPITKKKRKQTYHTGNSLGAFSFIYEARYIIRDN